MEQTQKGNTKNTIQKRLKQFKKTRKQKDSESKRLEIKGLEIELEMEKPSKIKKDAKD